MSVQVKYSILCDIQALLDQYRLEYRGYQSHIYVTLFDVTDTFTRAGKATLTSGLLLGRSEVLRSLRRYLLTQSHGYHTIIDRMEERGVVRGSAKRSSQNEHTKVVTISAQRHTLQKPKLNLKTHHTLKHKKYRFISITGTVLGLQAHTNARASAHTHIILSDFYFLFFCFVFQTKKNRRLKNKEFSL